MVAIATAPLAAADRSLRRVVAEDPDGPADGSVTVLPPIEVSAFADSLPWLYAETGGTEILSLCSDAATRAFMKLLRGRNAVIKDTLPAHVRGELAAPAIVVLFDSEDVGGLTSGRMRPQYMLAETGAELSRRAPPSTPQTSWAEDRDIAGFSANLRFGPPHDETLSRRWPYSVTVALRYLLERQYPQMPPWLLVGMDGHFRECTWIEGERSFELEPLPWTSPRAARAVLRNSRDPVRLLPLRDFFHDPPDEHVREVDATYSLYEAQAALFVRWALESDQREHRDAFWRFALRAADEPVSDEMFEEHFGLSIAAAENALRIYLSVAVRDGITIELPRRWNSSRSTMRSASEDEIGRIRAEWERLRVRASAPPGTTAASLALEEARRVARRGYEIGRADPRLLAVRGLIEVDAGNLEAARPFLEEAVRCEVARPAVYLALARLRLNHALENPGGLFGTISAGQLGHVWELLDVARTHVPLNPEVYELMAESCATSSGLPELTHLRMLAEGARLFPRRSELVCRVAELHAASGRSDEALAMVAHTLSLGVEPVARERLEELQANLNNPIRFRLHTNSAAP